MRDVIDADRMPGHCMACSVKYSVLTGSPTHKCPRCGASPEYFLRAKDDVVIEVNWHELRILGMWAERWALEQGEDSQEMQRVVSMICGRIHAQYPEWIGLTFSNEIAELRQEFGEVEVTGFNEDKEANNRE